MLERPAFKQYLRPLILGTDALAVLSEHEPVVLYGEHFVELAPLLTGKYTIDEIIEQLRPRLGREKIVATLADLRSSGMLDETDDRATDSEQAFWQSLGANAAQAARRFAECPVVFKAQSQAGHSNFEDAFRSLGIQLAETGGLHIIASDDYLDPFFEDFNEDAIAATRAWMLVKPLGRSVWVGPLFRPGITGCWECFAWRLRSNRWVETSIAHQARIRLPPTSCSSLPATFMAAAALAATETAKWIVLRENPAIEGCLTALDFGSFTVTRHHVPRRPQCLACGRKGYSREQKIVLGTRLQPAPANGYRVCTAGRTAERLASLVSPITGIIHSIEKVDQPGLDGFHVYIAKHAVPMSLARRPHEAAARPETALGKGLTDPDAKASCFGEALERYSIVFQGDEVRQPGTIADIGPDAVAPTSLLGFSEAQYRRRDAWNSRCPALHWVPEPLPDSERIDWTPVWSLTAERTRYAPSAYCYFRYPFSGPVFVRSTSNGCASGNTLDEAILQGFLELVERDAVALWWYSRSRRPGCEAALTSSPVLEQTGQCLATAGRGLWFLDLTTDLGIPVVAALSAAKDGREILLGFGAHWDVRTAAHRAVTELVQRYAWEYAIPRAKDTQYRNTRDWLEGQGLSENPYLLPREPTAEDHFAKHRAPLGLADALTCCLTAARDCGLEVLVLDCTRPEAGLSVARVIIPGLLHFSATYGNPRLYDKPPRWGWVNKKLDESSLNPVVFPL